jgi:actin-binding protein anillin
VISQASQALNLCYSTFEFSGSTEQVEGERLLLVASKYFVLAPSQLGE